MGTNFYAGDMHLGKRSAAGLYCWDCGITLCKGGEENIHMALDWYDKCPVCGQKPIQESLSESSVGRELGFNKSKPAKKTGVKSCSSFTWAVPPVKWKEIVLQSGEMQEVTDEYGKHFSIDEFEGVLEECPIRYTNMIGQEFS